MTFHEITGADLPDAAPANHGRTTAAWVLNAGLVVASLLAGFGIALPRMPLVWAGIAVFVVSVIAGAALKLTGHGQRSS